MSDFFLNFGWGPRPVGPKWPGPMNHGGGQWLCPNGPLPSFLLKPIFEEKNVTHRTTHHTLSGWGWVQIKSLL